MGLQSGDLVILETINLTKLFHKQIFKMAPLRQITFDPTQLVICSSDRGDVAAVSLIESKVKYIYLEFEEDKFITVYGKTTQL